MNDHSHNDSTSNVIATSATVLAHHSSSRLTFHIRQFQHRDFSQARELFKAGQIEYNNRLEYVWYAFQHDMSDPVQYYCRAHRSNFLCAVEGTSDEDSGTVIGTVGIRPLVVGDEDYYNETMKCIASGQTSLIPFDPVNTAELNRMAVSPNARRSGVARALIQSVIDWCASVGYTDIHLSTLATMTAAFRFYRSIGFTHYRTSRTCWENDPKIGTPEMIANNRRLRAVGNGAILESVFHVDESEVPQDAEEVTRARDLGVYYVAHFAYRIHPQPQPNGKQHSVVNSL